MIRYVDGELPDGLRPSIAAHLEICPDCRLEAHRLDCAPDRWGASEPPPPQAAAGPQPLADVMSGIHRWRKGHGGPGWRDALRLRVAAEVEPFLGRRATVMILNAVSEENENLLPSVESVLALFLGSRAAARLVDHIVDTSMPEA